LCFEKINSTNDLLTKHLRAAIPPLQAANNNVAMTLPFGTLHAGPKT